MPFGSDRSVRLTVGATIDGMVGALNRGSTAARDFSRNVASSAATSSRALEKQKDAAEKLAKPLLAIGTVAALGVGYAVKSYADFDEKMSSVKSLSHATGEEMEQLKKAALTTGTAIGFSATEAAEAEIELVKAGTSAADIYGGALSGSLKLAAAGQIDVADATSIAASTLTQFGLKGRDVGHIADLLAAGADKALGGVSDLGEGLKYIGPVAASAHVGLEQTVGSLALLAQNGILGEQAGTGLRGMLLSLTAPSKVASDVMKEYGINVYNARGKFVGFNGVAEQLHTKLGTLDDATRDAALGQIFGNAQITAATILMKGGAAEVDKWTKAVNEQGFATEQAVGKMDNLNGDLTKLKASFQTAAIVTGEAANGPLRAAVQVVTDLINTYAEAPGAVQGVVLGVGALTAAVGLSSGALLIGVPKVVAFGVALRTLAVSNIPLVSSGAALGLRSVSAFGAGMTGASVRTAGLSRVSLGAVRTSATLGKALSATSSFLLGPYGLALAAGAAAVVGFNVAIDSGAASQEELVNSISMSVSAVKLLDEAGQRSGFSKALAGDISKNLKDLPKVLRDLGDEGFTTGTVLRNMGDNFTATLGGSGKQYAAIATLKEEGKSLKDLGTALAQVASADAPAASRAFSQLTEQQHLSSAQASSLLENMKPYKAELVNQATALGIGHDKTTLLMLATGKYKEAAAQAKNPTKANADALKEMDTSAEAAAKSIEDISNALRSLTSPTLDARSAQRDFQAAVDAVTKSIKDNGKSLDIGTDKGRTNQAALDAIAQSAENASGAIYKQTSSQKDATKALQSGRDELVKALGQYGITGAAAEAYADKIIGTPKDWATNFANNAPAAGNSVDDYNGKVKRLPNSKRTTLQAEKAAAERNLASLQAKLNAIPGRKSTVLQAQIASAQANIDSLTAQLSRVPRSLTTILNVETRKTNTIAPYTPAAAAALGIKNHKAKGGEITGPGPKGVDSEIAWLAPGEHVFTANDVDKLGGQANVYRLRGLLQAGQFPKFSYGGDLASAKTADKRAKDALADAKKELTRRNALERTAQKNFSNQKTAENRADVEEAIAAKKAAQRAVATLELRVKRADAAYEKAKNAPQGASLNDKLGFRTSVRDGSFDAAAGVSQLYTMGEDAEKYTAKQRAKYLKVANTQEVALLKLQKQSDKAAKSVEAASDKLADLKEKSTSLASSVASNLSGNGISDYRSASSFARGQSKTKTQLAQLAAVLKRLKSKGLDPALLAQIAGMDPAEALRMASSFDALSSSQVKSVNSDYKSVQSTAGKIGQQVADANYKPLIDAAQTALKTAKANATQITKAIASEGTALRKLIGKALRLPGYDVGGAITGVGPRGIDSELIRAAPGEHMFTTRDVDAMGGQAAVYAFRQRLHNQKIGGYAGGGAIGAPVRYVNAPAFDTKALVAAIAAQTRGDVTMQVDQHLNQNLDPQTALEVMGRQFAREMAGVVE